MIWWILLGVVVLLAIGLVSRRGKAGGNRTSVDQHDVDRVRRDSQAKGFGSM
jgi:hypothetical protein